MIETDYTWIKPLAAPSRAEAKGPRSLAFPFGYIQPTHPDAEKVMRRYYPNGPLTDIPNTGPAPALLRVEEWMQVRGLRWARQYGIGCSEKAGVQAAMGREECEPWWQLRQHLRRG